MPDKDEIDVLLDSALATYADPGPESGLERRVLAAVAAERALGEERRSAGWWRRWVPWAIAVPVVASLLVWFAVSRTQQSLSTQRRQAYQPERAQTPAMDVPPTVTASHATKQRRPSGAKAHRDVAVFSARLKSCSFKTADDAACAPLPKLDVFPSPQPLSAEEQVLVTATHSGSKAERDALVALRAPSDAPLSIAALDVAPLAERDDGKN